MNMYHLPKSNFNDIKKRTVKTLKSKNFWGVLFIIIFGCFLGFWAGESALRYFPSETQEFIKYFTPEKSKTTNPQASTVYVSNVTYEQSIIDAARNVSPSVVSIVVSKNLPAYHEVGAGSGFIVSADGLVLTNRHVVSDNKADYTVITNDGQKYKAKVLALDPVQDLAVIRIQTPNKTFQPVVLGDSSGIQIGQTAIAIGNSLGQFSNTVSVGVVSGLQRTISASDQMNSFSEILENIIQTDAAINAGNSGGPLLNLKGEVMGINTAMAQDAQDVGFAIPINMAKKDIEQVAKTNKIVYPFLGVRYLLIDPDVKQKYKLSVDDGAIVLMGNDGESAVTAGSPAEKAGIKEKDIILQINGEKITSKNSMSTIIQKYNVGDKIILHILRVGKEMDIMAVLSERSS